MGTYTAPSNGGTVRGSNLADIVNGSSANDTLHGLGGADVINAGAGDDVINGDGTYTVNDAIRVEGRATVAYTGTVNNSSGLQLTSMGKSGDLSVWRVRNASNSDLTVVLESTSQGQGGSVQITIVVPAHSDYLVTSPKVGTHKLFLNGTLIDTKAAGNQAFSNTSAYGTTVEGDDTINAGDGNDTVYGNGGNDTLKGDGGNDTIDGGAGTDTINGGEGNDTITGGTGNDSMFGGAGDDTFIVEWSDTGDAYNGGDGTDTFKADVVPLDIYVQEIDLATGTNNWGDTFTSIENIIGSNRNDKFWGDAGANSFWGREGNDLLDGRGGDDKLYGENGDDTLIGGGGADLLDGGAGTDTADFSSSASGVTVDLLSGKGTGGDAEGDTLVAVENLTGSGFNDTLKGNTTANAISGGAGNDVIEGGAGADAINGGDGSDTASYAGSTKAVTLNLSTGEATGGDAAGDVLTGIENLTGSKYADSLWGDTASNTLDGGEGDDVLHGDAGADLLIGGDGLDLADYTGSNEGVYINLATGEVRGGHAEGDVLVGIENLRGSIHDDVLIGSADTTLLDGGGGNDILDYSLSTAGVNVNILTNIAFGGFAEGDTIANFEDLRGSALADFLTGNNSDNEIISGDGDDNVDGGSGNDSIFGGQGNDALKGGDGEDTIEAGIGNDRLTGGNGADKLNGGDGVDTADYRKSTVGVNANLLLNTGTGGEAQGDSFSSIENLSGSAFNDVLTGDDGANRLSGMSGEDKIYGMGGNDYITTGGGYDYVDGGDGIDTVTYEESWDKVSVNLTTGVNKFGEASRDVLVNVENIVGSKFNDIIVGDAGANRLTGGAGNDTLNGMGGIDYIYGGAGNDTMTGGTEADVFVFEAGFGNDTITDFWTGAGRTDRIWVKGVDVTALNDVDWSMTDSAAGAVITIAGHGSLTLTGVTVAQLQADDFIFG